VLGAGDAELCDDCAPSLLAAVEAVYCRRCGDSRREYLLHDGICTNCKLRRSSLRVDHFVRVGPYDGALKVLVNRFKHRMSLKRLLGGLLADAIRGRVPAGGVDAWVPVPAHWRRRWATGFDRTRLLACAAVGRSSVIPALRMCRFVAPFHRRSDLSPARRAAEIHGAFEPVTADLLSGLRLGVIDDVTNTGATLGEARRALQDAGAKVVAAAVIAKTTWSPTLSENT
jgi:predicted amidophosphoribosyltransferase